MIKANEIEMEKENISDIFTNVFLIFIGDEHAEICVIAGGTRNCKKTYIDF